MNYLKKIMHSKVKIPHLRITYWIVKRNVPESFVESDIFALVFRAPMSSRDIEFKI